MEAGPKSLKSIQEKLSAELPLLRHQFHVTYLGIFGSYVRDEQQKNSDIDLLVDFDLDHYPGYFELIALKEHLADLLHADVDLVTKSSLRKRIGKQILNEAIEL